MDHNAIDKMQEDLAQGRVSALTLVAAIRLEYLNNYLTQRNFAEDHGIPVEHVSYLLTVCRAIHDSAMESAE